MKNYITRLCTSPFTRPLLVETAISRLWHEHLTGRRQVWEGHIVFRDPSVLRSINPKIDPAVFTQNLKNASVPSWKGFVRSLSKGQRELHPFLPDHRQHASVDIMSEWGVPQ